MKKYCVMMRYKANYDYHIKTFIAENKLEVLIYTKNVSFIKLDYKKKKGWPNKTVGVLLIVKENILNNVIEKLKSLKEKNEIVYFNFFVAEIEKEA